MKRGHYLTQLLKSLLCHGFFFFIFHFYSVFTKLVEALYYFVGFGPRTIFLASMENFSYFKNKWKTWTTENAFPRSIRKHIFTYFSLLILHHAPCYWHTAMSFTFGSCFYVYGKERLVLLLSLSLLLPADDDASFFLPDNSIKRAKIIIKDIQQPIVSASRFFSLCFLTQ